ncbi:MAG: molybdopterin-dependent oxidoreductase [Ignavibacteriales bacterium]|nr:molybdopterin-dependent oxidoreductase [Ignavibacteriales bacterium]
MKNYDSSQHVQGTSLFLDDMTPPEGTLVAFVAYSKVAHGKIEGLYTAAALGVKGVKAVLTAKDIPGENQIGGILKDEELLAHDKVDFIGQPVALVIAENKLQAAKAARLITMDISPLPAVFTPREAYALGSLIMPPKIFSLGDIVEGFTTADVIVEGVVESGGQEHLYLETQCAMAVPSEGGSLKIFSSTQGPTVVQRVVAGVLGMPMHKIEVDVTRLGGGFGGKEDQASAWAALAALAAWKLKKSVKLVLPRQEDMRMTGKRHPYSSDFKIGLKIDGTIVAFEATYYQNAGASADLSPAILERTLFHATNGYYIPNVKATAVSCKTNLPPNTAFRGFGGPQGIFVIEAAIYKAAEEMGIDPLLIQEKNLMKDGDEFPYGQIAEYFNLRKTFERACELYNLPEIKSKVKQFNRGQILRKKGVAVMPVCFGISFTTTFLNQASSLIHVYTDGSVSVNTAAIEMGQGVNAKIHNIVQKVLGCHPERIRIDTTNTSRIANTSATAASKGADLNGFAAKHAAEAIYERLKKVAAGLLGLAEEKNVTIKSEIVYNADSPTTLTWTELISKAYMQRVSLSAHAHHATPLIHYDKVAAKGRPFAYHVTGTAIVETTVDCLRGTYKIDSVKIVHDIGESLHHMVDLGQVEGALAQGIGWMTVEEVIYNNQGRLITDALSTYKVPDIHAAAQDVQIEFLENAPNPYGPLKSKAVGEPPLMYGIGAYFSIMNAIKAFRPGETFPITAPMSPERVLRYVCREEFAEMEQKELQL